MYADYDGLKNEFDELNADYQNLRSDYDSMSVDYDIICTRLDEAESELCAANEALSTQNEILNGDPDEVWCWFCDKFGISHYDKDGLIRHLNDLVDNKLKKSMYYGS